jgi:AraC-like DNA-binding protein
MVNDANEQAVLRAIVMMRDNLGEALTVDDLARSAMFSKFHFTRVFQRVTGVTPARFLSAMRLQRAKQLLVTTELNVAHISAHVGFNSVGTFSSRFSRSVGMSPTYYRRLAGHAQHVGTDPGRSMTPPSRARIYGNAWTRGDPSVVIFLGLFPGRVPEGRPRRCAVLNGFGEYELETVPPGKWYLLAQAIPSDPDRWDDPAATYVCTHGPITVSRDSEIKADVELKPLRVIDPPVLIALLDVRKHALGSMARQFGRVEMQEQSA